MVCRWRFVIGGYWISQENPGSRMNENQQREIPSPDEFCAKAAEFRQLAQRTEDPTMAEAYRKLAEGYETLARYPDASRFKSSRPD